MWDNGCGGGQWINASIAIHSDLGLAQEIQSGLLKAHFILTYYSLEVGSSKCAVSNHSVVVSGARELRWYWIDEKCCRRRNSTPSSWEGVGGAVSPSLLCWWTLFSRWMVQTRDSVLTDPTGNQWIAVERVAGTNKNFGGKTCMQFIRCTKQNMFLTNTTCIW